MKIASVQLNIQWHNKQYNLQQATKYVEKAAKQGCQLIIFPEMFNTGYSMDVAEVVEPANGDSTLALCLLAKTFKINIIAGLAQTSLDRVTKKAENVALFIDHLGQLKSRYVKNYPFTLAGETEHYFTGDNQAFFEIDSFKGSLFICYDLRFPELFRQVAKTVDMMVVIASWPETRQHHWELLLQARAIENQCFVIGVNRTGQDGNDLNYAGGSLVCDPMGEILSRGGEAEEYIETNIDIGESQAVRKAFPFLDDIKPF